MTDHQTEALCEDCPPVGYPTHQTRCTPCPRRTTPDASRVEAIATYTPPDWFDPAAQSDRLTVGQDLVAAYESDVIAEPCELAIAIDATIARLTAEVATAQKVMCDVHQFLTLLIDPPKGSSTIAAYAEARRIELVVRALLARDGGGK